MNRNCSILFVGVSGLLFTGENGMEYMVQSESLRSGTYDKVLFSNGIKPIGGNKKVNEDDRKMIVSKILELTKGIHWLVK